MRQMGYSWGTRKEMRSEVLQASAVAGASRRDGSQILGEG